VSVIPRSRTMLARTGTAVIDIDGREEHERCSWHAFGGSQQ
jgi:hypothetical protein